MSTTVNEGSPVSYDWCTCWPTNRRDGVGGTEDDYDPEQRDIGGGAEVQGGAAIQR